jgi:hypothetical protein
MAKSAPFSIRLSTLTDELVTREARRTRRSKGAVVEMLTEEQPHRVPLSLGRDRGDGLWRRRAALGA